MGGKTSTSSQTVSIPPEVLARYNAVNSRAEDAASHEFKQYSTDPNAFVAPLTESQQSGIKQTMDASGQAQPYYQAATGYALNSAQAVNPSEIGSQQINKYMSPYMSNVVNAQAALLNQQNQQQQSGQMGQAIRSGAFGGDRAGIAAANLAQQQNLANSQIFSNLLNQGYGQALSTAQQQQGVQLSADQANRAAQAAASQQLAGLGAGAQAANLQGAQAKLAAGQTQQQTEQAGKTALYNQFLQQQSYPFQVAQFLANIAEGTGALSGSTTTTTQPGGFFSDERLKENIHPIGKTHDGQNIYRYNYKGEPETRIGLLAQEVEHKHPEAVGLAGGYKTVDYDKATRHSSMGGGVHPHNLGEGFADGGMPYSGSQGLDIPNQQNARELKTAGPLQNNPTGLQNLSSVAGLAGNIANVASLFMPKKDGGEVDSDRKSFEGDMPYPEQRQKLDIPQEKPSYKLAVAPSPPRQESGLSQLSELANIFKAFKPGSSSSSNSPSSSSGGIDFGGGGSDGGSDSGSGDGSTTGNIDVGSIESGGYGDGSSLGGNDYGYSNGGYDDGSSYYGELARGGLARGKFAAGGEPTLPGLSAADYGAMLQAQAQMFGPFGQAGMYGGAPTGAPHGGVSGYVPQGNLPVSNLTTAGALPQQTSPLEQMNQVSELGKNAAEAYAGYSDWKKKRDAKKSESSKSDTTAHAHGGVAGGRHGYALEGEVEGNQDNQKKGTGDTGWGALGRYLSRTFPQWQGKGPDITRSQVGGSYVAPTGFGEGAVLPSVFGGSDVPEAPKPKPQSAPPTAAPKPAAGVAAAAPPAAGNKPSTQGGVAPTPSDANRPFTLGELASPQEGLNPSWRPNYTQAERDAASDEVGTPSGYVSPEVEKQAGYVAPPAPKAGLAPQEPAKAEKKPSILERARSAAGDLKAEQVIPFLTGLAAMGTAPTRSLGVALASGVGAGARSYLPVKAALADIAQTGEQSKLTSAEAERTRALTQAELAGIPRESVRIENGIPVGVSVWDSKSGQYTLLPWAEYLSRKNKGEKFSFYNTAGSAGTPQPSAPATPDTSGAAGSAGTTQPGAAAAPAIPATATSLSQKAAYSPDVKNWLDTKVSQNINVFDQSKLAGEENKIFERNSVDAANARQNHANYMQFLTSLASSSPKSAGPLSNSLYNPMLQYIQNVANIAGIDVRNLNINPADLANNETITKNVMQLAADNQSRIGSSAYQELVNLLQAYPSSYNSREGQAKLISGLITAQKRLVDKDTFNSELYNQMVASGLNPAIARLSGSGSDELFQAKMGPKYQNDKRLIESIFDDVMDDRSGRKKEDMPRLLPYLISRSGNVGGNIKDAIAAKAAAMGIKNFDVDDFLSYFKGT